MQAFGRDQRLLDRGGETGQRGAGSREVSGQCVRAHQLADAQFLMEHQPAADPEGREGVRLRGPLGEGAKPQARLGRTPGRPEQSHQPVLRRQRRARLQTKGPHGAVQSKRFRQLALPLGAAGHGVAQS